MQDFCAEFLKLSNAVQIHMGMQFDYENIEMICLCSTQIVICIRHLEQTINLESASGLRISASHQHFIERIRVCLKRMWACFGESSSAQISCVEGASFFQLLDSLLDSLSAFTSFFESTNQHAENLFDLSKEIKTQIDLLLGQTLSFANVALQQDKKALSALCQKARVMRDGSAFQEECQACSSGRNSNYANQKLKALTLESGLSQLETYINEALLRLVFNCFIDFQKISVDKIRNILRTEHVATADEYIADFDVNLDRATQIGVFAIAFAPSLKLKTLVRSCLASFEYLDTSLIPSLYANAADLHSELLEQHYNEEVSKFKCAIQQIIDSHAMVGCYMQLLATGIEAAEKHFDKTQLDDLTLMGFIILEHFKPSVNQKQLTPQAQENLKKFVTILRECKAILMCAAQVETQRILKRFKILRSTLRNLHGCLAAAEKKVDAAPTNAIATSENCANEGLLINLAASPTSSILYDTRRHRNRSLTQQSMPQAEPFIRAKPSECIRRKQSLRTAMFKRQNIFENHKQPSIISSHSASLEIS
ncbi:CG8247, partial [Drosophila busckii]